MTSSSPLTSGTAASEGTGKIILVTGINGYIASHIGLLLLQHGHTVRGTARSAASHTHLLSEAFMGYESRYQSFVVPDMTIPGAFDEAVRGVHGIIHVASPVDFSLKTVDEFFGPAISSVAGILESVEKAQVAVGEIHDSLQRQQQPPLLETFVLTSSIAAVVDRWKHPPPPHGPVYHYTEADWNTSGEEVARKDFTAPVAYGASKAAAEKMMWEWREERKPQFAMCAVNPGVVTGPPVNWPAEPARLNETVMPVWKVWSGQARKEGKLPPTIGMGAYVDVRDVAKLHVHCVENPREVNGQRYLATRGKATPEMMSALLRDKFPDRSDIILEGQWNLEKGYEFGWPEGESTAEGKKMYAILGGEDKCKRFDESVLDTVEAFEKRWPGLKVK